MVRPTDLIRTPAPDYSSVGSDQRQQADNATGEPDLTGTYTTMAHPGDARLGLPPGVTLIDFNNGEVVWEEDDAGNAQNETLRNDLTALPDMEQIATTDTDALRSFFTYADADVAIDYGGANVQLDPCSYFQVPSTDFQEIRVTSHLPTDLYMIASTRTQGFSTPGAVNVHLDRSGGFSAQPANDTWETIPNTVVSLTDANGFPNDSNKAKGKIHSQNFTARTFVFENTGANDVNVRIQGQAGHAGTARWQNIASDFPVTLAPGDTLIHTNRQDAWHLLRAQVDNINAGEVVEVAMDMSATSY